MDKVQTKRERMVVYSKFSVKKQFSNYLYGRLKMEKFKPILILSPTNYECDGIVVRHKKTINVVDKVQAIADTFERVTLTKSSCIYRGVL